MIKRVPFTFLLLLASLSAQTVEWDHTGNGLLSGQFRFREIIWNTDAQGSNMLSEAAAAWGTITFDGSGNYAINAQVFSSLTNQSQSLQLSGTYAVSASGLGFIRRPNEFGGWVYGMISHGVFIGSATESGVNDLFIAAKAGGTPLSTDTFNQNYTLAYVNLPGLAMNQIRSVMFRIQGNGAGGLATSGLSTSDLRGAIANSNPLLNGRSLFAQQTIDGSTYSFSNGIGTLNFNATAGPQILVAGSKELYASPGGAFVFGGSTTGFDMFVGIPTPVGDVSPSVFNYLYYQVGMEIDAVNLPSGKPILHSFWGALTTREGDVIGHRRLLTAPATEALDFTYSDHPSMHPTIGFSLDFMDYRNLLAADGIFRVGIATSNFLGITVSVKAPELQGSGVFLNPVGVVNAASFTPFTVGVSPGAVMTLFGAGIAENVAIDSTFPVTLNGLEVRINGQQVRIYKTSPGEVSVVVPYDLGEPSGLAEIQVIRNGVASNRITTFIRRMTPGIFTQTANGIGYAAALHPDFSLVTPAHPALPGEIVSLFLSGMGSTDPAVVAGTPAPVSPLSVTTTTLTAKIGSLPATVHYSGLAPLLGGLYQLNVEIPFYGLDWGEVPVPFDARVEVQALNGINIGARLPIGVLPGATASGVRTAQ